MAGLHIGERLREVLYHEKQHTLLYGNEISWIVVRHPVISCCLDQQERGGGPLPLYKVYQKKKKKDSERITAALTWKRVALLTAQLLQPDLNSGKKINVRTLGDICY